MSSVNNLTYSELLQTDQWKKKRKQIKKRDNYMCRNCGCTNRRDLQVHHKQYHHYDNGCNLMPWDYLPAYLVTLCSQCHGRGHEVYKIPSFTV